MDTLRGPFGDYADGDAYDPAEDEIGREAPPQPIGQDERRLQVRAYNHWASLLGNRAFPLIADLETGGLPDFDPYSVLLDVSGGIDNPAVRYIGSAIAAESECDPASIRTLAEVPGRSLLSRLTDHYMQILANQAPIGFEAEFVNQRGGTILYRGILLPFSGSMASEGIDLIYGVINWKELADQHTTDTLMQEIDRVLSPRRGREPALPGEPLAAWADGPLAMPEVSDAAKVAGDKPAGEGDVLDLGALSSADALGWGAFDLGLAQAADDAAAWGLADILASARELAEAAHGTEERGRKALYAAIGRAHDFALAAVAEPDAFAELVADAGLAMQERAPLIPLVKLVFGAAYDKTRLTEYATVIGHARRLDLGPGALADFLARAPGGLKGVVHLERRLRREEKGDPGARPRRALGEVLAGQLRALPARPLGALAGEGEEFALLVARRTPSGEVVLVGEVSGEPALLERAARKLIG